MRSGRTFIAGVIFVVALLALAAGVIYLTTASHALPSFFPGHSANIHALGKHSKRGIAGVAVGAVLLVISTVLVASGRRRRHY